VFAASGEKAFRDQHQFAGAQAGPLAIAAEKIVTLLHVLMKALQRTVHVAVEHDQVILAGVVEKTVARLVKERQVPLHSAGGESRADVFVNIAARRIPLEAVAPAGAKTVAAFLVERKLAPGQDPYRGNREEASLGIRVKALDGVDQVIEQIDPQRKGIAHWKKVDQASTDAILARLYNLRNMLIAGLNQLARECIPLQLLAPSEHETASGDKRAGWQQEGRGCHWCHQQIDIALEHAPQGLQAFADQILVG